MVITATCRSKNGHNVCCCHGYNSFFKINVAYSPFPVSDSHVEMDSVILRKQTVVIVLAACPDVMFEVRSAANYLCIGGIPWHYIMMPQGQEGSFHVFPLANKQLVRIGIPVYWGTLNQNDLNLIDFHLSLMEWPKPCHKKCLYIINEASNIFVNQQKRKWLSTIHVEQMRCSEKYLLEAV